MRARTCCQRTLDELTDDLIWSWVAEARDRVARAAERRQLATRDFATTMICVISDGSETVATHVGDGCAVIQYATDQSWHALSWPSHGEYASSTFFVTDDPQPKVRISRHCGPISALIAFTDGLERLALDFAATEPHAPFFQGIIAPVVASTTVGHDCALSAALARYLDSDQVNARTDDDKTLLVAAHK